MQTVKIKKYFQNALGLFSPSKSKLSIFFSSILIFNSKELQCYQFFTNLSKSLFEFMTLQAGVMTLLFLNVRQLFINVIHQPKAKHFRNTVKSLTETIFFELTYFQLPLIRNVTGWCKSACFSRKQNLYSSNLFIASITKESFNLETKTKTFCLVI